MIMIGVCIESYKFRGLQSESKLVFTSLARARAQIQHKPDRQQGTWRFLVPPERSEKSMYSDNLMNSTEAQTSRVGIH